MSRLPLRIPLAKLGRLSRKISALARELAELAGDLALWFSLHTLFATVNEQRLGPLVLQVPALATLDIAAAAIALGAAVATLCFHVGMLRLICGCAGLGMLWRLLAPGG